MAKKKPAPKKKVVSKRIAKKKSTRKKKSAARKTPRRLKKRRAGSPKQTGFSIAARGGRGLQAESGGQSGDVQGLSRRPVADSESVEELVEEGQYLEADAVSGVENAKDPDEGEVRTREVPEDDVPGEYTDRD